MDEEITRILREAEAQLAGGTAGHDRLLRDAWVNTVCSGIQNLAHNYLLGSAHGTWGAPPAVQAWSQANADTFPALLGEVVRRLLRTALEGGA